MADSPASGRPLDERPARYRLDQASAGARSARRARAAQAGRQPDRGLARWPARLDCAGGHPRDDARLNEPPGRTALGDDAPLPPLPQREVGSRACAIRVRGLTSGCKPASPSICRSSIEAHDGQMRASANEPRGAVFHFVLPAKPDGTGAMERGLQVRKA